jgi:hypothetical protein
MEHNTQDVRRLWRNKPTHVSTTEGVVAVCCFECSRREERKFAGDRNLELNRKRGWLSLASGGSQS